MERDGEVLKWSAKATDGSESNLVEFVITDGNGDWDKPPTGDNYCIQEPGSYRLKDGVLSKL
jgi:hypothetical protein